MSENCARNLGIYSMYKSGAKQDDIALHYGITQARVNQIIKNQRLKYEKSFPKKYKRKVIK